MIKALLFDLDGTLIDTSEANFLAYKKACEEYGFKIEKEEFQKFNGMHFSDFLPILLKIDDQNIIEKIHKKKQEIYPEFIGFAKQIGKVFCVLKENCKKYKTALVTTASSSAVEMWDKIFELKKYFDVVVNGEDVKNKKPSPEGYLLAARLLEAKPKECLVFEDLENGFEAAKKAGMDYLDINSPKFLEEVNKYLP